MRSSSFKAFPGGENKHHVSKELMSHAVPSHPVPPAEAVGAAWGSPTLSQRAQLSLQLQARGSQLCLGQPNGLASRQVKPLITRSIGKPAKFLRQAAGRRSLLSQWARPWLSQVPAMLAATLHCCSSVLVLL